VPAGRFRHGWRPQFVGDFIALPIADEIAVHRTSLRTEIRAILSGEVVATIPIFGRRLVWTADGKFAWDYDDGSITRFEVYDAATGRRLLADETADPETYDGVYYSPTISKDGRFALSPATGTAFDIETGERRWRTGNHERLLFIADPGLFEVVEDWRVGLGGWEWPIVTTFAFRSQEDGSLFCRTWRSASGPTNEDRSLIWSDQSVRQWLPRVNYFLLALCQTILALPLILLWAALRWRRKRRMRIEGVRR
jgi:hypothetical protein